VELSGFRTETRQGVAVRVNDSAVVDFELVVAPVAETIIVQGGSSGVQLMWEQHTAAEQLPLRRFILCRLRARPIDSDDWQPAGAGTFGLIAEHLDRFVSFVRFVLRLVSVSPRLGGPSVLPCF